MTHFREGSIQAASIAVIAACLLSCGVFAAEEEIALPELPEPPRTSRAITYPVKREGIMDAIEGTAQAVPTRMRSLYFLVPGRIQSITVEPDQEVSAGDVLAGLEIDDLVHQLALARIDGEIAEANLELIKAGTSAVEQRIQRLVIAKHKLNITYLERRIDSATIRAPFDGVVQRVQGKVSDLIREYEPVIEISDPEVLELQMNVSENEFNQIQTTLDAEVQNQSGNWVTADIIQTTYLDPRQDATVKRAEYIVHLESAAETEPLKLHQRIPCRVILIRKNDTLTIPAAGLREFSGRSYVRVLEGEARREIDVKVGIRTDTKVEILDGLREGELVIGK